MAEVKDLNFQVIPQGATTVQNSTAAEIFTSMFYKRMLLPEYPYKVSLCRVKENIKTTFTSHLS